MEKNYELKDLRIGDRVYTKDHTYGEVVMLKSVPYINYQKAGDVIKYGGYSDDYDRHAGMWYDTVTIKVRNSNGPMYMEAIDVSDIRLIVTEQKDSFWKRLYNLFRG